MIKLSTKGRYGTRLMLNLALHYQNGNEAVILKNISDNEEISIRYLEQIIIPLKIAKLVKIMDSVIITRNVDVKIEISDAARIDYLYKESDKPGRDNQINEFFHGSSENYVGELNSIPRKIAGHSYYSTYPINEFLDHRISLYDKIQATNTNLEYWQSEYCILEDNSEINGNGRDLGMDAALYMARVMHYDLTLANASAWYWWLAVSLYDYKDGLV